MNNSYSGNFFPSPLSGKFTLTSTPKKTQKKLPRNIDVLEYLEDPSLTILREDMLRAKSFDSVSTQDLERLYWHLRDYSYYCGRISNYDEALETEKLLEYVFLELKDRKLQSKSSIYSEILNPTFFQNQQMKWMQQLINFDEETEKKAESIKDRHTSEIRLLESRWKQSRLRPYNKLSPSLRDLTNNEQTASTAGDFATARNLHDDIMNKRKEELKEAQYKADNEYNSILISLKQRQAAELDNFLDTRMHKRELLIRKQQNDLDTIEDKANISLYRMNHNKPYQSSETSLPFRGLVRPFIQTNQLNANLNSPKLLPPIRPPPLKNENWTPQKSTDKKKIIKCVPKTRHKIGFQSNEFDLINAMEVLKRRFSKITQDKNDENEKNTLSGKKKKKKDEDDLFDFNAYYEKQRNPANLKPHVKKKKKEEELPKKEQPYFEPIKRKMNVESIMKKVKEKEANKRKPPVIHSKRKPLRPPKRNNKFNSEEEEEEYEDEFNENESNIQFKQKVDVTASKNDAYDRIIDEKKKNILKTEDIKKEKKISEETEIKSIEIIKKGRSKPTEKYFSFKEKDKNELKLFFCEQDKNIVNEFSSSYYSNSVNENDLINNNINDIRSEKGKKSSSTKKSHKKISNKKSSDGNNLYSYSSYYYNYSDYSTNEAENTFKDRDGNNVFIVRSDIPKEKRKKRKKEYTKIIKIDYDYTNIKNEYEEEVEEEVGEVKIKNNKEKSKSHKKLNNFDKNEENKDFKSEETHQKSKKDTKNASKTKRKKHSKKSVKKVHKKSNSITSPSSSSNRSSSPVEPNDARNKEHHEHHNNYSDDDQSQSNITQNSSHTQNSTEITSKNESESQATSNPEIKGFEKSQAHKNQSQSSESSQESSKQNETDSKPTKSSHKNGDKTAKSSHKGGDKTAKSSHKGGDKTVKSSHKGGDKTVKNSHKDGDKNINSSHKNGDKTVKSSHKGGDKNINSSHKNDGRTGNNLHSDGVETVDDSQQYESDKNDEGTRKKHHTHQDDNNNHNYSYDSSSHDIIQHHQKSGSSYSSSGSSEEVGDKDRSDTFDAKKDGRTFSYTKVSHINIKTDTKDGKKAGDVDLSDSLYVPKLAISSVVPLETPNNEKKKKKSGIKVTKTDSVTKDRFETPKPKNGKGLSSDDDDDGEKRRKKEEMNSKGTRIHGGRSIAKRAATRKMSPKMINNAVNPLNDGSLFGGGVETKSSGVVKIKH